MKNYLLFALMSLSVSLNAQLAKAPVLARTFSVKAPIFNQDLVAEEQTNIPVLAHSKSVYEEEIGQTVYDLQSNVSDDSRIVLFHDGTVGTTYTMGFNATAYAERGTGYNYFDGTAWGALPTVRVENLRTGWPSYYAYGANGEMFISHAFGTALIMCKRDNKGTGPWIQTSLPAVSGFSPGWPRACVNGNSIHIIVSSNAAYNGQTNPFVYYRSQDGGQTWNKQAEFLPGLSPADGYVYGFGADVYDWANPVGNTIAFVVGTKATDLILMKSTDDGDTWTKTVIFQHPYPFWADNILTPDTPYVCDGAHAVSMDASGTAYVAFGLNRFLNSDTTDGSYSWFPGIDGLAIWKEGEPTFTSANPDDVYNQGRLLGSILDLDGSGVVLDNYVSGSIASYQVGCTSQPQITINGNGEIYVVYKSLVETMMSSNSQFYNHLYGRWSPDGNLDHFFQCNPVDITSGQDHDYVECVYPAMAKTTDGNLYLNYMSDFEPGTALGGDADVAGTNSIIYLKISESDLKCPQQIVQNKFNLQLTIYPNPATEAITLQFSQNQSLPVHVTILNSMGNVVKEQNMLTDRGVQQINIRSLAAGLYMAKCEVAGKTLNASFIKK